MNTYLELGQIAGIGGITIGLISTVFGIILKNKVLSNFSSDNAFKIVRLIIILSFLIGVIGIGAWVYLETRVSVNHVH